MDAGFSSACVDRFEDALCYVCDPTVGTHQVTKVCHSLCDSWYNACKKEFFSIKSVASVSLDPCRDDSLLCSPLESFVDSGLELCTLYGYSIDENTCYDGRANPNAIGIKELKPRPKRPVLSDQEKQFKMVIDFATRNQNLIFMISGGVFLASFFMFMNMGQSPDERRRKIELAALERIKKN